MLSYRYPTIEEDNSSKKPSKRPTELFIIHFGCALCESSGLVDTFSAGFFRVVRRNPLGVSFTCERFVSFPGAEEIGSEMSLNGSQQGLNLRTFTA